MSDSKWQAAITSHPVFKLNLLVCAISAAKISDTRQGLSWLQELPWATFGSNLQNIILFKPVDAGAIWAFWLTINATLLAILLLKSLARRAPSKMQKNDSKSKPILLRRWDDKLIESHKLDQRLHNYNPDLKLSTSKLRKILNEIDLGRIN